MVDKTLSTEKLYNSNKGEGGGRENLINLAKKTVALHNHSIQLCGNIHFSLYSIFCMLWMSL